MDPKISAIMRFQCIYYIYIYKEDWLSVCLSFCLNAFAEFSRYRAETLQVGRGRPGAGRGGVKNFGGTPGGGDTHNILTRCKGPGNPASI